MGSIAQHHRTARPGQRRGSGQASAAAEHGAGGEPPGGAQVARIRGLGQEAAMLIARTRDELATCLARLRAGHSETRLRAANPETRLRAGNSETRLRAANSETRLRAQIVPGLAPMDLSVDGSNAPASLCLVPTMGALHDGHLSLITRARQHCTHAIASIFVNPTQFAPNEDFARYPREEATDLEKLRQAGCALAWLPSVADIYPPGDATAIEPAGPARGWEGERRPGHFRGVATVVAKLFGLSRPDAAIFGEKDWQQLQVIRRMTQDLLLGVEIIGGAVVRETDGLAMSSRNRFLTPQERATAPILHQTLNATRAALHAGAPAAEALQTSIAALTIAGLEVDYLALVDGPSLQPTSQPDPTARLITAARLGSVRLLDNIAAG